MNRPLRHIAVFCGVLVLALLVRATWVQFVQADELANDSNNRRVKIEAFSYPRGNIIVDGQPVTGSTTTSGDFKYKRTYKDGAMYAPITGFASQGIGVSFLEANYNKLLSGKDDRLALNRAKDILTGEKPRGGDILTTINGKAQKAAYKALTDLKAKGAVVALDPRNGNVLAMASTPSYDPSAFAAMGDASKFAELDKDKSKPLSNRALRETYPPGSTFKILTAAAALEHGVISDINAKTDAPAPYQLPLSTMKVGNDVKGAPCANASLKTGMQWSCNNVFLDTALKVGKDKMRETAEKFGFNSEIYDKDLGDLKASKSLYPEKLDKPQTAMTGMGQGSLTSTPMQMAMVTAALANDGKLMMPHVVDELRGPDLSTIQKFEPKQMSQAVSADTAKKVQEMMEYTVNEGTASKAKIDGVTVGGKTGTAQHGVDVNDERPYAWFVSYAKQADGTSPIAVAVFVDPKDMDIDRDEIAGGKLGGPIAKAVMEAVLKK
ncbi:peptidoglycan D,D-transpeptidase FtsI family protein [Streptomyces sp. NPDC001339]|uniref:peptidoglycan D,D-transpeptidase FtsI family protein n=1 Tax=Streptomyces sp. NPDC001339 TaxID=3364563 RepID=UPI003681944F